MLPYTLAVDSAFAVASTLWHFIIVLKPRRRGL
jgi:hypothetical protein